MPAVQCLSCDHDNPDGAKFCQECGSPLNLKLCKQCEAINGSSATSCHSCGTQFAVLPLARTPEVIPSRRFAAPRIRPSHALAAGILIAAFIGVGSYLFYREPGVRQAAAQPALSPSAPASAPPEAVVSQPSPVPPKRVSAVPAPSPKAAPTSVPTNPTASTARVTHTKSAIAAPVPSTPPVKADTAAVIPVERHSSSPVTHTKTAVAAPRAASSELEQTMQPSGGQSRQPSGGQSVNVRQDQPTQKEVRN